MQASGWGETDINEAFESSPLSNTVSTGKTSLRFLTKKVVLVIIGAAVIGGGVFGAYYFLGKQKANEQEQGLEESSKTSEFSDLFSKHSDFLKPYSGSINCIEGARSEIATLIQCIHTKSISDIHDYFAKQLKNKKWLVAFRESEYEKGLNAEEVSGCQGDKMIEITAYEISSSDQINYTVGFRDISKNFGMECSEDYFIQNGFFLSKSETSKYVVKTTPLPTRPTECELSKISRDLKPYPNSVPVHAAFNMPFTIDGQTMALVDQVTCIAENATSEQYKDHFVNLLQSKGWTIKIESEETPFGNAYQISAKKGQEEIGITTHFAGYNVGKFKF